ncbi:DUF262 domain-containing protein [Microbispora hainanensis]|uniref:GmrSD restriction endonuclease domain-containing protein n=1 Tax=Microbispora hainanensis TaxID=568844 RepID=UPI002E27CEDC|nr:DUF262 domain-containing protein [Microbispora hainanensis]
MLVEKTERPIAMLVHQISCGEIKLPEIQRGYVWNTWNVAKLIDSLYRKYPSGTLVMWKPAEAPRSRQLAIGMTPKKPTVPPLYLLDGQQRLTSLHRVLNDHKDAQIAFNIETEEFKNQTAESKNDPRWIKVYDILRDDVDLFEIRDDLLNLGLQVGSREIGRRLSRLASIKSHSIDMKIVTGCDYEEIVEIFERVNSGRPLKTVDLALAMLSVHWPGILKKIEEEAAHWADRHYSDINVQFLALALNKAVIGRSDGDLEQGWETVRRGLRHLVPLLTENLKITSSALIPSHATLLPVTILLGERPDAPLDAETRDGILYWFLLANLRNRYNNSTDTMLGRDIPAAREQEPVKKLLANLGVIGTRIAITPQDLAGKSRESAYFTLSYLVAKKAGAQDWWFGTEISAIGEDQIKLEHHHVHPQATLKNHAKKYSKGEINDLANLAFISAKANRKISDRSPSVYFVDPALPPLTQEDLAAHFVPYDEPLRDAANYREFLVERRRLLAAAMTKLLDSFRPAWLSQASAPVEVRPGCTLEFVLYQSHWDIGRIVAIAKADDASWIGSFSFADLETAIDAANNGLDSGIDIAGQSVPVRVEGDIVEIAVGPFMVSGTIHAWHEMMNHARDQALPLSQLPALEEPTWTDELIPFPVTSVE